MKKVFWAVTVVVAGWMTVFWLDLESRQVMFGVILAAGLFLLMSLRQKEDMSVSFKDETSVNELLKSDALSPEDARKWLDSFLVEQQQDKK
ncbi:MAG: hypothetical protein ABIH36_02495 [bacterium]